MPTCFNPNQCHVDYHCWLPLNPSPPQLQFLIATADSSPPQTLVKINPTIILTMTVQTQTIIIIIMMLFAFLDRQDKQPVLPQQDILPPPHPPTHPPYFNWVLHGQIYRPHQKKETTQWIITITTMTSPSFMTTDTILITIIITIIITRPQHTPYIVDLDQSQSTTLLASLLASNNR